MAYVFSLTSLKYTNSGNMKFFKREWPLIVSAVFFACLMAADYQFGFMTNFTSLTSGRQSELFVSAGLLSVLTLAFLEGILGIDNATVLAIQVRHLKPAEAHKALTWGVWGAFLFRFLFLVVAGFILEQKWILGLGGFYLINMAADFFLRNVFLLISDLIILAVLSTVFYTSGEFLRIAGFQIPVWPFYASLVVFAVARYLRQLEKSKEGDDKEPEDGLQISRFTWKKYPVLAAIVAVEWTDILFSFDSIGAGVALTRDFWVLFWGAFFGVTCLRLFAKAFIGLLDRFPQLEAAAMFAVLVVGLKMSFEAAQDTLKLRMLHIENWQTSLVIAVIFVGSFFMPAKTPLITEKEEDSNS